MAALEAALDIRGGIDIGALRARSAALSQRFIDGVEVACPDLALTSPRDPGQRGSQVSLRHPEGYAIVQAPIAPRAISDFRAPDILRFAVIPPYIGEAEIDRAITSRAAVMTGQLRDCEAYQTRTAAT